MSTPLELRRSRVETVAAAGATRLSGRRLDVDVDGLRTALEADARLGRGRIDLVHPGERCRIGRVFDVVAPRSSTARTFPACSAPSRGRATA